MQAINRPTMQQLLEDICKAYDQDPNEVLATERKDEDFVKCRRLFCYIAYLELGYKTIDIYRFLRFGCHSSVSSHVKKVRTWFRLKDSAFMIDWEDYLYASKLWPLIKEYRHAA